MSNGVKQGGIISRVLFNIYIDDLSCVLNCSNIGERLGGEIVNHLRYADDLCLICLSSAGMQKLFMCADNMQLSIACHIMPTSHIICALKLPQ